MTRHITPDMDLSKMSISELADLMELIQETHEDDKELSHVEADDVMLAAVRLNGIAGRRLAKAYAEMDRWYA